MGLVAKRSTINLILTFDVVPTIFILSHSNQEYTKERAEHKSEITCNPVGERISIGYLKAQVYVENIIFQHRLFIWHQHIACFFLSL